MLSDRFDEAFLEERIFCHLPKGYEEEGTFVRLRKALYGTQQAANAWQKYPRSQFARIGGVVHPKDECVYIFREGDAWVLTSSHVDDIFALANKQGCSLREKIKSELSKHMIVEDKGTVS